MLGNKSFIHSFLIEGEGHEGYAEVFPRVDSYLIINIIGNKVLPKTFINFKN
jgi:hypothetical protein